MFIKIVFRIRNWTESVRIQYIKVGRSRVASSLLQLVSKLWIIYHTTWRFTMESPLWSYDLGAKMILDTTPSIPQSCRVLFLKEEGFGIIDRL